MHPTDAAINDYVDDALGASERADVERHLEGCAACRTLAGDLRDIRQIAASLDPAAPPARVWSRIEHAIGVGPAKAGPHDFPEAGPDDFRKAGAHDFRGGPAEALSWRAASAAPAHRWGWLAAAAILIAATGVGLWFGPVARRGPSNTGAANVASPDPSPGALAQSVEAELRQAEAHYDNAIKGLEQIANTEQDALDAGTAATLHKSLAVIDEAIGESRAALRAQPDSQPAQQSLLDNFKSKLALLQDTVALINEMRKGNEAGAARIVSGLKQKGN